MSANSGKSSLMTRFKEQYNNLDKVPKYIVNDFAIEKISHMGSTGHTILIILSRSYFSA